MFAAILWPPYVGWQPCHGLPKLHEWSRTRHRVTSDPGIITLDRLWAIDRPAGLAGRALQGSGRSSGPAIMRDCGKKTAPINGGSPRIAWS